MIIRNRYMVDKRLTLADIEMQTRQLNQNNTEIVWTAYLYALRPVNINYIRIIAQVTPSFYAK